MKRVELLEGVWWEEEERERREKEERIERGEKSMLDSDRFAL